MTPPATPEAEMPRVQGDESLIENKFGATNKFGPWDYAGGAVYDLGRADLVKRGIRTYRDACTDPYIHVQPGTICSLPDPSEYTPSLDRQINVRNGCLIAELPALLQEMIALKSGKPTEPTPSLDRCLVLLFWRPTP